MAIDPSIALNVRPIEQPNMLGQMAQVMAMRQAQQEYEGLQGVNELTRRGEKDPYAYMQYGKPGRDTAASITKIQEEKLKSDEKRNVMLGGLAGPVMENPTLATFNFALDRAVNYNLMTPTQKQEVLAQYGGSPESIKGYVSQIYKGSINAQAQQANATSIANNAATVGASYYSTNTAAGTAANRLRFDEKKDERDQEQLKAALSIVSPTSVSSATATPINMSGATTSTAPLVTGNAPMSGGRLGSGTFNIPMGGAQTPATSTVGQPNVLATQVAPQTQTDVNAFNKGTQKEQLVSQISQLANLPTIAGARLLENKVKEYNVLYPTEKIEQDRQGNLITVVNGVAKPVLDARGLPVQGKPLTETAFESTVGRKTGENVVAFVERAQAAPKNIAKIDEALGILKSGGAVTGFGAENRLNLQRAMSLFGDDVKAGKRVVDTQILDALLGSDVFPSLQSMGLGSKNIDTPAEREYIRQVITGTIQLDNDALIRLTQIRRNVETNAIKEYNQKLESGKFDKYSKAAGQKLEKIEVPNPIIRKGKHKNGRSVIEYADGTVEYGN